jgi:hypothetical protein
LRFSDLLGDGLRSFFTHEVGGLKMEDYPEVTPSGVPRTREFLIKRIDTLKAELDDIQQKIDLAKRTARSSGVYCDPEWLTNLEAARRRRGTAIASLEREIPLARKREQLADSQRFERLFMLHAKAVLDEATYFRIIEMTHQANLCGVRS